MEDEGKEMRFDVWCKMGFKGKVYLLHVLQRTVSFAEFADLKTCFEDDAFTHKIHEEVLAKLQSLFIHEEGSLPTASYKKCIEHRHWTLANCSSKTVAKVDFFVKDNKYLIPVAE